jgi:hypothetical protein
VDTHFLEIREVLLLVTQHLCPLISRERLIKVDRRPKGYLQPLTPYLIRSMMMKIAAILPAIATDLLQPLKTYALHARPTVVSAKH